MMMIDTKEADHSCLKTVIHGSSRNQVDNMLDSKTQGLRVQVSHNLGNFVHLTPDLCLMEEIPQRCQPLRVAMPEEVKAPMLL